MHCFQTSIEYCDIKILQNIGEIDIFPTSLDLVVISVLVLVVFDYSGVLSLI